jgi:CDGSH-type Zn-finger protein
MPPTETPLDKKMFRRSLHFLCCKEPPGKAVIAATSPYKVTVKAGQVYAWCSCGLSKKQPFCDGAHKAFNAEHKTEFRSIKFTPEADGEVFFCGCKKTESRPWCDGSHESFKGCGAAAGKN